MSKRIYTKEDNTLQENCRYTDSSGLKVYFLNWQEHTFKTKLRNMSMSAQEYLLAGYNLKTGKKKKKPLILLLYYFVRKVQTQYLLLLLRSASLSSEAQTALRRTSCNNVWQRIKSPTKKSSSFKSVRLSRWILSFQNSCFILLLFILSDHIIIFLSQHKLSTHLAYSNKIYSTENPIHLMEILMRLFQFVAFSIICTTVHFVTLYNVPYLPNGFMVRYFHIHFDN